ncbi:MAG TPA: ABC transporter substrate-binding protein [Candidatus Binataceae bacterium]|nr:ABC transporter substrate-binding protein [Candidatus Binataceae bacterium]
MLGNNYSARNLPVAAATRGSLATMPVAWSILAGAMLALMLAQAASPAPAWAALPTPLDTVNQVVNKSLPVLRDKGTPLPQRRRQLRDLLENHFDFADMARIALGYHWRGLSAVQRSQFTKLFTAFIESAYLDKIQDYAGQDVAVLGQNSEGQGYARVRSQIVQSGKQPIKVDYLLRELDGDWKIYDVTVDAISIVANYRNQFNRVINDQGFDKLMANMRAKQQQLQASMGS